MRPSECSSSVERWQEIVVARDTEKLSDCVERLKKYICRTRAHVDARCTVMDPRTHTAAELLAYGAQNFLPHLKPMAMLPYCVRAIKPTFDDKLPVMRDKMLRAWWHMKIIENEFEKRNSHDAIRRLRQPISDPFSNSYVAANA